MTFQLVDKLPALEIIKKEVELNRFMGGFRLNIY